MLKAFSGVPTLFERPVLRVPIIFVKAFFKGFVCFLIKAFYRFLSLFEVFLLRRFKGFLSMLNGFERVPIILQGRCSGGPSCV